MSSSLSHARPGRTIRVQHVARRLGIPDRTVRHWAANGKLPAFKDGKKLWAFRSSDIDLLQRRLERSRGHA